MHFLGPRERKSKIYLPNVQSIPLNRDEQHQKITEAEEEETKYIMQKKNIDKILLGVVKQRMFGTFLNQGTQVSEENYFNIDTISKQHAFKTSEKKGQNSRGRSLYNYSIQLTKPKKSHCGRQHYLTINSHRSEPYNTISLLDDSSNRKKRSFSRKLPKLIEKIHNQYSPHKKIQANHHKKLDINQKNLGEIFKKWAGGMQSNQTIYDIKISRETILNAYKNIVDPTIIERFFHFFNFPQTFGLRYYCNLVEHAINYNLKFIYFWVFALFDQNSNGIVQSQDLFRFLQRFPVQNSYIEKEVYEIQKYLIQIQKNFKPRDQKELVQQTLVVNHNLKLDELKDLLKLSEKQRIDVSCVKNTCYSQTLTSIEHDANERLKISKIETNQLETKKLKQEMMEVKKKLQNTPGLRLRDFYVIFGGSKRPKIFCYFISLLTGQDGSIYQ